MQKAPLRTESTQRQQARARDASAERPIAQREADNPRMAAQRQWMDGIHNSPRQTAQRRAIAGLHDGARLAAQRKPADAPQPNHTGLPDRLKSGVEQLSGMSLDHVKVHYNSAQPAQLNALAYAQGGDIHVAPGKEQHLPHEAWHVVQQAQGRVKPTLQMKPGVAVNDDAGLEQEADAMGAAALLQRVDDGAQSAPAPRLAANGGAVSQLTRGKRQRIPARKTKAPRKGVTKRASKAKAADDGAGRYSGHDSTGNKRAILEVLDHRADNLGKSLSHPEEKARKVNANNSGVPETGLANKTKLMARGTAICHKISDKSIRDEINGMLAKEGVSKDPAPLDSYIDSLITYINPAHVTDETPSDGLYAKAVADKYINAVAAQIEMTGEAPGSAKRRTEAHIVGKNVANSPVNLFLGDSVTNSSIQEHFDQNTYKAAADDDEPPLTPRSKRAEQVNDKHAPKSHAKPRKSGKSGTMKSSDLSGR